MSTRILLRSFAAAMLLAAMPASTATAVVSTPAPAATAQKLTNLKTRGTAEIDRRIANLQAAQTKLAASSKLTTDSKTTLEAEIRAELTGLGALKTKLAAETDLVPARVDVASIIADYRVYALMLPKTRMVASADRFAVAEEKLTVLHDKLATKAKAQATVAYSASPADVKLQDMATKIAAAKTASDSVSAKLLALKPTDYNSNHAVLVQYRASLKTAQEDLKAARDDAKAVIDLLGVK